VILGYTELLLRQAGDGQRGKLEQILKATTRATGLTRQLLAFSRKQIVDPKVLDINALLSDLETMVGRLIGEDIDLAIVPGVDLGQVKADPGQLEQVVMNLCVNARDAMPDGGMLRIETANAEVDVGQATRNEPMAAGRYVMLAVSDTGCGIREEMLPQIFEPFFTTKEEGKGTGLGLAMVYGTVKQAGGYVWVYSEVGRGTTFQVYLPRIDEPAEAPLVQVTPMPSKGWETILLVEDEGPLRAIAREILEEQGYRVLEADGPENAIETARLHPDPIHLVLTDVVMPGMNGRTLTEKLVAARPEIKVLYMSGYTDDVIAHSGGAGVRHPLDREALPGGGAPGARACRPRGTRAMSEVVGSWPDVTERKAAERRIAEGGEEYRLLFDSNPHPMWVFDAETLAFLAVNDAAVRLYGYSRAEFLAMTIKDIRPREEVPALLDYLTTIPDTPSLPATQVKHRKKDGSLLEVAGSSNPISFHGRRARLVMATDVSEKKRLEMQLLQAHKLEAVGRLAGGVAHDFNNLLGVITGYSELLLKDLGPQHPGSKRVGQIQMAADRAATLTRQLLAFGRKQVLRPRVLDLNDVVTDMETMLRRLIGEDVQLVTTYGAGIGRIQADPGQIEQVLMNLVVNARDAMPKGGRLTFETANVALDESYARAHPEVQPGRFVMLAVIDTGVGMDAQTQAHLFEPFFTTKETGQGTGLGLATVIGIVQQSGGQHLRRVVARPWDHLPHLLPPRRG
jgi:PAS domain S-box-containing protein